MNDAEVRWELRTVSALADTEYLLVFAAGEERLEAKCALSNTSHQPNETIRPLH